MFMSVRRTCCWLLFVRLSVEFDALFTAVVGLHYTDRSDVFCRCARTSVNASEDWCVFYATSPWTRTPSPH